MERIADEVRTRTGTGAVAETCGIAEVAVVGNGEGRAGLNGGDAGNFPAAEDVVREAGLLEEWQRVNVAGNEVVLEVEVGTRTRECQVVGISEAAVETIGRIVDRVTVGISQAEGEITDGARRGDLQCVVDRVC